MSHQRGALESTETRSALPNLSTELRQTGRFRRSEMCVCVVTRLIFLQRAKQATATSPPSHKNFHRYTNDLNGPGHFTRSQDNQGHFLTQVPVAFYIKLPGYK